MWIERKKNFSEKGRAVFVPTDARDMKNVVSYRMSIEELLCSDGLSL